MPWVPSGLQFSQTVLIPHPALSLGFSSMGNQHTEQSLRLGSRITEAVAVGHRVTQSWRSVLSVHAPWPLSLLSSVSGHWPWTCP